MVSSEVSIEEMNSSVAMERPHVVLLGAGASLAACPHGDANGKRLPLMTNFTELVPLGNLVPPEAAGENFESFFSRISKDPTEASRCERIQEVVRDYFTDLQLPTGPNLYDYLLLSLREKDVIATFNWDPFLLQALKRNKSTMGERHPRLLFLHGNVLQGVCHRDRVIGFLGGRCSRCRERFAPTALLYPVEDKDYAADAVLADTWQQLRAAFSEALLVTVFGYGAPKTDAAAMELLRDSWGQPDSRAFEQLEFVDIRAEEDLTHCWRDFIHTHHYDVVADYFDSSLGQHPRRSVEDFWFRNMEVRWTTVNPAPRGGSLESVQEWFEPLLESERSAGRTSS